MTLDVEPVTAVYHEGYADTPQSVAEQVIQMRVRREAGVVAVAAVVEEPMPAQPDTIEDGFIIP